MDNYLEQQRRASNLRMALLKMDHPTLTENEIWEMITEDTGAETRLNIFYESRLNIILNHLYKNGN